MFGGKLKTARKFTMKASTQVFVDYAPTNFSPDFKSSILGLSNIFFSEFFWKDFENQKRSFLVRVPIFSFMTVRYLCKKY